MVTTTNQPGAYRALLNHTDGIVRQVVELHQPTPDGWQECRGCPEGDNPGYWIVWPCRTTRLIAEQVGVALDEDHYTVDMVIDRASDGAVMNDPDGPAAVARLAGLTVGLTDDEHKAVALTAELWNLLCSNVIGDGPSRAGDIAELCHHIHAIQRAVLAQAGARAYPDLYRLLGSVIKR